MDKYRQRLLIEVEKWYRKKFNKRNKRIVFIPTSIVSEYFQEKRKFKAKSGRCIICNNKLSGKKKSYCSNRCRDIANMFVWEHIKCVFNPDEWKCVYCGSKYNLEVDHIRPIANGGLEFDLNNLRVLCQKHNRGRKKPIPISEDQTDLTGGYNQ